MTSLEKSKRNDTRRVAFELAPSVATELDRMQRMTDLTRIDIFRHALTLLRVYLEAKIHGKSVLVVDPKDPSDRVRIEMPIQIRIGEPENL